MQQVDHRPQVATFFDVDLEQIAKVVQAGCDGAQVTLLLNGRRLGVTLDHDQALQAGAVLTGHLLPGRVALVLAEGDASVRLALGEKMPQR